MCGIVGIAGNITVKHEKAFKDMLDMDVVRGPHSTGIATVDLKGEVYYAKSTNLPSDLFQMRAAKNVMQGAHAALIGHNRYATMGSVNSVNAHPFEHGTIVGAHNGTLNNWRAVLDDSNDFDVDSDALIYNIAVNGVKETISKLLGAWTLVWHDSSDNTLNFLRNKDRPLHFAYTEDDKTLFYASEPWMIQAAAGRNDIKVKKGAFLKQDTLLKIDLPARSGAGLGKSYTQKITGAKPPVQTYNQGGRYRPNTNKHFPSGRTNTGGNDNKSNNFRGQSSELEKSCDEQNKALRALRNQVVNFYPCDYRRTSAGFGRLKGIACDTNISSVEIYCEETLGEKLAAHMGECKGLVASTCSAWIERRDVDVSKHKVRDGYLVMRADSVKMLDENGRVTKDPILKRKKRAKAEVLTLPKPVERECNGPNGKPITEDEFKDKAKGGCCICSDPLNFGEVFEWFNGEPVCQKCEHTNLPKYKAGDL